MAVDTTEGYDEVETAPKLPTETAYKAASFIETYTGRKFSPLRPTIDAISIIDIAHSLSNQCRYSGHTREFYSVAQHCCLLSQYVASKDGNALDCLQMLMHDAAEGYLLDIPRPIKQYMPEYRVWDNRINETIRAWMKWETIPLPGFQDELDSRIIMDERAQLMSESGNDWSMNLEPLGIRIEPWSPKEAERQFLMQYTAYSTAVYGHPQYVNYEWGMKVGVAPTNSDSRSVIDLVEVDIRGGVARVSVRDKEGVLARDRTHGVFPAAKTKWVHGRFELLGK